MMGARPQAVGYGLTDSPAGLAGWMLVHSGFAKWSYGMDPKQSPTRRPGGSLDNLGVLADEHRRVVGYGLDRENRGGSLVSVGDQKSAEIKVPVAITVFPDEVLRAQEAWARRAFPKLTYFNEVDRGGHFAMWVYPELFATELRAAFRSLR